MKKTMLFWVNSVRPFSWPASAMPIIVCSAYLIYQNNISSLAVQWFLLPLVLIAGVLYHSGSNMISDLRDHQSKVDNKESLGYHSPLVKGEIDELSWYKVSIFILALGTIIGFMITYFSGLHLLWIGAIGLVSGYGYKYFKYNALGDAIIFISFGLFMTLGAYYSLTSTLSFDAILLSVPVALITVGILHANNTRDIISDTKAGMRSQASLMGVKYSKIYYLLLILGAYAIVGVLIFIKMLPYTASIIIFTLPIAISNIRCIMQSSQKNISNIIFLDVKTAQLQLVFSISLSVGIIIGIFL